MKQNVLLCLFQVESEAYQAMTELKRYPQNDQTRIAQAVLVKKQDGRIIPVDGFDPLADVGNNMLTGGLIGSALGILGGPLGVLFGASVGAWVGSTGAAEHALADASLVETVAARLKDGDVAIISLVQESRESILDTFYKQFRTEVVRWDAAVIQQELEDALEILADLHAKAKADLKARRREARHEKLEGFKASIRQKFDEIAEKFRS